MILYHRTCVDHGAPAIRESGLVVPQPHQLIGIVASWWAPMPWATRQALALSSTMLDCDRMAVLFMADVDPTQVARWYDVKPTVMERGGVVARQFVNHLEAAHGARPDWWYVAPEPIAVVEVTDDVSRR